MRKANKIVMMTVAILLSAVLLTTSALSGTLAKYVTSGGSHSESARVAKWGVTVRAWVDAGDIARLKAAGATVNTSETDKAMVTITGLKLKPGDDFSDVIKFRVSGSPEVKARVKLTVQIKHRNIVLNKNGYNSISVPAGVADLNKTTYFMPLGYTFGANNASNKYENNYFEGTEPWRAYDGNENGATNSVIGVSVTEAALVAGAATKIDVTAVNAGTGSNDDSYFYKDFDPNIPIALHPKNAKGTVNKNIKINQFDMGFVYPLEWPPKDVSCAYTADQLNTVSTYFGEVGKGQVEMLYTIEIIQIRE
jgi:hypothetical protein